MLKEIKARLKSPVVIIQLISVIASFIMYILPDKSEIIEKSVYTLTAIINIFAGLNNPADKENF